jgi:hypothetical protein
MPGASTNQGLYRIGGMYGAAYRDGRLLAEVVEVQAAIEVNRIDVPLVGQTKGGYKPGRETREGTIIIQHIDDTWELEIYNFLSQGLAARRAARGTAAGALRPFSLMLEFDDPDALGYEAWQLDGCLIWRLPLGFSITDDIVNREFPLTWESERPLSAFSRNGGINTASGQPAVTYKYEISPQ